MCGEFTCGGQPARTGQYLQLIKQFEVGFGCTGTCFAKLDEGLNCKLN